MIQESPSSELMITLSLIELIAVCLGLVGVGILIAFIVYKVFSPADKSHALPRNILYAQNQEEYFKELLTLVKQSAHISVWSSNVETGEFFSDAFFWELYGISPIENLDISDTAHAEDLPRARALVRKVVKNTNGQNRYEIRHRTTNPHKDKQYIQSYFNVLRNETGQATHIIGISWDVTEEVEKEQRLKAMAARFEVAVKSASLHVWEFDYRAGRYTWLINPIKNFGLDDVPLESFHKAIYKIALPEDRHIFYDSPTEAYQSGKDTYTVTQRYRGKDGNVIHFKGCIRILSGTSIEDFRVLGVGWDETDKVLRENTLQEQIKKEQTLSQRLDVATRASNFSPWEFDLNTKSYSWLGAKISNKLNHLTDKEYSTFLINSVKPEVRSRIIDVRKKAIKNGLDYYDFQYELENIDGSTIHAKSHVRILRNEKGVALKLVGVVADITEYINMNQRLEKQTHAAETLRQRLKLSIQTAGIAAFELDMRTRRFDWIENSIDGLKGSSGKDQSLNEFQKRVHPDDQNLLTNNINKALSESTDSISYRYRYYNNDGELRHMQIFCKIFLDNDGVVEKLIGAGWDVSSEVNSANKLYAQTQLLDQVKRRLERASISSSEGHWERNLLDQSAWCSSSFYTLLGYNKDVFDTQGDLFKQLLYTEDYSTYEIALQSHLYGNTPFDIKVRLIRANQENRWFRLRGMAERNQQGDPVRVAGSIQDIHQQKLNEDVLYQTQQRFERAINGTQDGLYEFDFANDTIWCSPRLSAMLGYPAKQLETPGFAESLIHPDDVDNVNRITTEHFRHNKAFDIEIRVKHRNGNYIWYHVRANSERDHNNRVTRLSGSFQDVTAAHTAREELIKVTLAANAAEAASKTTSAFLANVSHEIRTPMNGITGMSSLLKNTALTPTQREYVNTISNGVESLLDIISDILDFSKLSDDHVEIENTAFNLRHLSEDLGTVLPLNASNQGLELIVNVSPELPTNVIGSGEKIKQCLLNLVANAIKFTKQGEVVINVYTGDKRNASDVVHFEVCDTGIGIKPEALTTLCKPFVQEDWSDTRGFGGTGLGLSIVQRLLELMDSKLNVRSELGKGSVFSFELKLPPAPTQTNENPTRPEHLLIVDDNSTFRQITTYQLAQYGYSIETASSEADALLKIQHSTRNHRPFAHALIELYSSDSDGRKTCQRISKEFPESALHLILVTPPDSKLTEEELISCGASAQIAKPIKTSELLPLLQENTSVDAVTSSDICQQQTSGMPRLKNNAKVLLVEDNAVNQKVASRLLENMGCDVTLAVNGEAALSLYQRHEFDIVFMDIQMPIMDGITATEKIREFENTTNVSTPIVALTANALNSDRERCKLATMDGFITKPINPDELFQTLLAFTKAVSDTHGYKR